jgi:5-methylphenazine-1-carboxylate 1-monooxygenase
VLSNCQMGPERMIGLVAARAPDGFQQLEDVVSPGELEAIAGQYRKLAGFEHECLGDSRE